MNLERTVLRNLFNPEIFNLKPEDCDSDQEFLDIVADEAWNLDEWTPEGMMMIKHFVFKMVTKGLSKKDQIDYVYFKKLIQQEWQNIK